MLEVSYRVVTHTMFIMNMCYYAYDMVNPIT